MAVIFSYPIKSTPDNDDLILISDGTDKLTKQVRVSSLPGVSSLNTLTGAVTITGGTNVTLNTVGNNIEINAAGGSGGTPSAPLNSVQFNDNSAFGGSANLTFATDTLRVTHTLDVRGDGTNAGKLKLYCQNTTTPHAVTIEGPDHANAATYTLKLPSPAPTSNQVLEYENSTNNLRWINTPSGGGSTSPASPLNSVQFNNNGSFGGSGDFNYNDSTKILTIGDQDVNRGIVNIAGGSSGAGELRLGDPGTSGGTVTLKGGNDHATSYTIKLPDDGPANNNILESDASGNLTWINTPTGTTYSAGTGLALNGTTFSLASGAALTNLGGGTGTTFLRKDGTWATPQDANTNIANSNLQLDNNRNLDLSNGDAVDYALTFISTLGGASKNLFKFDQIGGTSPRFTVGHTESAYEGYVVLEGNGSSRTGILQFENAAGTYYTSFQAPNTFGANQNIGYVLPNLQGTANSVLTNNGSGTLSWTTTSEPTEITSTTAVNPTSFAATPFTFASTNAGSGVGAPVAVRVASQYGNKHISFYLGTTFSGGINQSGSNTVNYATSSDYRLKENVVEMTGAVNRVKQLNPSRFNFIADGPSRTVDGFLAHEVSNIVPEAITGSKDAVDAEGNIIPQGIDQSKLVPLLVGAIKELTARIEALEA